MCLDSLSGPLPVSAHLYLVYPRESREGGETTEYAWENCVLENRATKKKLQQLGSLVDNYYIITISASG